MIRKAFAAALVAALALTSCTAQPTAKTQVEAGISEELKPFYSQVLNWKNCDAAKCATIKAPLDWQNPSAGSINLALAYVPSTGKADKGWLLENPGGPGASGIDLVKNGGEGAGSADIRKHYNLVGFDPRGVGASSKVTCLKAEETDHFLYDSTPGAIGSDTELKATIAGFKQFAAACQKNTGDLLAHVDTVSAARDMDIIRALLGEEKLNYLGFSYGTFLGTTYATLYPSKVGRFVLDGAVDPTVSDEDSNAFQLQAFDSALKAYLKDCVTNSAVDCPFTDETSGMKQIIAFYKKLETTSLSTTLEGRRLYLPGAITGLIVTLYSNDNWQYTTQAFAEAFNNNDGTMFLRLADFYNDRNEDGTYATNSLEAFMSINCLDARSNPSTDAMNKQNARLLKLSPLFGRYWRNGALSCARWPYPVAKRPVSYAAEGSGPILVIGTTGDPATPYWEAQNLANKILANGHLVTYKGEGHTAYGRSNACIVKTVDNYLLDGTVPTSDPNC